MWKFYYTSFKINGPVTLPVLRNILELLKGREGKLLHYVILQLFAVRYFADRMERYGKPFRMWLGTKFIVVVTQPEDIQIILNDANCMQKSEFYRFFFEISGNSVFAQRNSKHFF